MLPVVVILVVLIAASVILVMAIVLVVVILVVVCAGVVIDTFVEVLAVAMWADAAIVVSGMSVEMDAFTALISGALNNFNIGVLFLGVLTAFEFAMPGPLEEEFRC